MNGQSSTGTGILLCGLNGAGKSTLGRALAEKLGFHFIDNEDLYFPKTDPEYLYASPRTREEQFLALVRSRAEDMVEAWARSLRCPILRVDGTKPVAENVAFILERMQIGFSP